MARNMTIENIQKRYIEKIYGSETIQHDRTLRATQKSLSRPGITRDMKF